MFYFYLITAWRNLKKDRLISIINILCLSVGLTCSVFALFYSINELTYENYHQHAERVSRVYTLGKFGSLEKIPATFGAVGKDLQTFPEIEKTAVTRSVSGIVIRNTQPFNQGDILVAEDDIYDILTIRFTHGRKPEADNEIALTEKTAVKYFGNENATGKFLNINIWGRKLDFQITGVIEDLPGNTHLKVSAIIPMRFGYRLNWDIDSYESTSYNIYTLSNPGTDIGALNLKLAENFNIPVDIENVRAVLVPIKRIHLYETINENNKGNLYIILIGGIVALLLSCFSYINLTTILFNMRKHEVGIKKVNGGSRRNILMQFLTDTGLTTLISIIIAFTAFYYLLPDFNNLMGRQLNLIFSLPVIITVVLLFTATTLVSGFIPALRLSKSKPVQLVRKDIQNGRPGRMKNSLLTVQFVVAIILLQFFIISQRQGEYMFRKDVTGYDTDNLIAIDGYQWGDLNVVKDELLKNSAVEHVSWSHSLPGMNFDLINNWKEERNKEMALRIRCSGNYTDVFRIKMLDGRFFSDEFGGEKNSVVINSLTAASLEMNYPVGKSMKINGKNYNIVGLVDNFQAVPVIFDPMPLIMLFEEKQSNFLLIRVDGRKVREAHAYITQVLSNANPDYPVDLKYYIEYAYEGGKSFVATSTLMNIFTLVIILNAMLGLFGLSFFIAQSKNKEVGIRKVCGASVKNVIWKLSRGFALKLLTAIIIATPLTWVAGQQFVSTFTHHIPMTPDLFLIGAGLALLMVVIASGWKIADAALRNPVESLKYE